MKKPTLLFLAFLSVATFSAACAPTSPRAATEPSDARPLPAPASLAQLLEDARAEARMPGLRAAIRRSDGSITRAAVGLADVEARLPLDDSSPMPGGSTGKTFVAALTILLVEDGVLSIDDLASKWLRDTPWFHRLPNAESIRVRHLLSHTAGIRDYPASGMYTTASAWRAIWRGSIQFTPEELIGFTLDKDPLFPVGEGFWYTDAGYLVLGRLIEAATGETYSDLLTERILVPHQLDEIIVADRSVIPGVVPGYMGGARNLRKDGTMKCDPSSEWTGGGLATNPTMLVKFYGSLMEGRVVAPESLDLMLTSGWRNPNSPHSYYGFGLFVDTDGSGIDHGGLWPGYRTHVIHDRNTGTTIAVQTNRAGRIDLEKVARRIEAWALGRDGEGSSAEPRP